MDKAQEIAEDALRILPQKFNILEIVKDGGDSYQNNASNVELALRQVQSDCSGLLHALFDATLNLGEKE